MYEVCVRNPKALHLVPVMLCHTRKEGRNCAKWIRENSSHRLVVIRKAH